MYQVGDKILYGTLGVCKVTELSMQEPPGGRGKQLYYTLEPLYQECLIRIPAEDCKVFMRPIISREEANRLIDLIPTIRAEAFHTRVPAELSGHYEETIKSHDCADLIEMTMSIYAKKQEVEQQRHKFGTVDERFMKRAEELLFGELAAALDISREEIPAYIAARVESQKERAIEAV